MPVTWDDNYIHEIERTVGQRVRAAGIILATKIKENVSVQGTSVAEKSMKRTVYNISEGAMEVNVTLKRYKKGRRIYNSNPSKPGEFPHKQHGWFRTSVASNYDPSTLTARVGSPLAYAKFLELGTAKMLPRPWLRRTLAEEQSKIIEMIQGSKNADAT